MGPMTLDQVIMSALLETDTAPRRNTFFAVTDSLVPHLYDRGKVSHIGSSHGTDVNGSVHLAVSSIYPKTFKEPIMSSNSSIAWIQMSSNRIHPPVRVRRRQRLFGRSTWLPSDNKTLLTFQDGLVPLTLTKDDFRSEPIVFLDAFTRSFPW
ncbi:hypothetical protein R3P38DRAFT_1648886 [Favolaschia claudopus]|uniref:Uncharacterized protein n=1 Tax=Favolaschia claudopus TaxID=2862362 RepID=A0AAW0DNC8_9AGAR